MDKASERKKDAKAWGDTDIGVHDYGAGGKREQLPGIWDHAGKEVVGQDIGRLITNNYCKEDKGKSSTGDMIDDIVNHGPPYSNVSKPKAVDSF